MEFTVFAKKRQSKDGRQFYTYITTLVKKGGEAITTAVKFREAAGQPDPKDCPMNIIVDKKNCNFTQKLLQNEETGQTITSNTLWVTEWTKSKTAYVDHSMDDFE